MQIMSENQTDIKPEVEVTEPIIINLRKQPKKRIKKLLKGRGKLWVEVVEVIDEVRIMLGDEIEGKTILPIILVYGKKAKKKRMRNLLGL
jgi:endonuclease V-like protein UPF0215 family